MVRHLRILLLAIFVAVGLFIISTEWHANAAIKPEPPWARLDAHDRGPASVPRAEGQRTSERRVPSPAIDPYVRPEFAGEMRSLRTVILAAAQRHNRPALSGMTDHDFAVLIALIMYNEHFGWFEERVKPVQLLTPWYEDLQRQTNEAGISNLSIWPANIRPSVALEILHQQMPLPNSTRMITVPVSVFGSQIPLRAVISRSELYSAITAEISDPAMAVEYLAANLERGLYRAKIEHTTVTWRTLAAWHNQGIVSPHELSANATASDYVHRASAYFGVAQALIDTAPPHVPSWKFTLK